MNTYFRVFLDTIKKDNPAIAFSSFEDEGIVFVNHSSVHPSFVDGFMENIGHSMEVHLFSHGVFNIGFGYDPSLDAETTSIATYNAMMNIYQKCTYGERNALSDRNAFVGITKPKKAMFSGVSSEYNLGSFSPSEYINPNSRVAA